MSLTIMSVTHLAAHPIQMEGRTVQRCGICGEKLIDTKKNDGAAQQPSLQKGGMGGGLIEFDGVWCFPPFSHVRIDGGAVSLFRPAIEEHEGEIGGIRGKIPTDICMDLVE